MGTSSSAGACLQDFQGIASCLRQRARFASSRRLRTRRPAPLDRAPGGSPRRARRPVSEGLRRAARRCLRGPHSPPRGRPPLRRPGDVRRPHAARPSPVPREPQGPGPRLRGGRPSAPSRSSDPVGEASGDASPEAHASGGVQVRPSLSGASPGPTGDAPRERRDRRRRGLCQPSGSDPCTPRRSQGGRAARRRRGCCLRDSPGPCASDPRSRRGAQGRGAICRPPHLGGSRLPPCSTRPGAPDRAGGKDPARRRGAVAPHRCPL